MKPAYSSEIGRRQKKQNTHFWFILLQNGVLSPIKGIVVQKTLFQEWATYGRLMLQCCLKINEPTSSH
jgi:hypothetical protein